MVRDKYYCDEDDSRSFCIKRYKREKRNKPDMKFVMVFSQEGFKKADLDVVIDSCVEQGVKPTDITVSIRGGDDFSFTREEWEMIKDKAAFLKKRGVEFGFEDLGWNWTIEEVENANRQVTSMADEIKEQQLSPAEQVLAAYMMVGQRRYVKAEEGSHTSASRSVYSVTNSESMVCVGFASLMKAILEEVGNENIKIYSNSVNVGDGDNVLAGHRNLIIYIKDEKYGLDGYYYCDPTWGRQKEGEDFNLLYFLVPIDDISKINPRDERGYSKGEKIISYSKKRKNGNEESKTNKDKRKKPSEMKIVNPYGGVEPRVNFTGEDIVVTGDLKYAVEDDLDGYEEIIEQYMIEEEDKARNKNINKYARNVAYLEMFISQFDAAKISRASYAIIRELIIAAQEYSTVTTGDKHVIEALKVNLEKARQEEDYYKDIEGSEFAIDDRENPIDAFKKEINKLNAKIKDEQAKLGKLEYKPTRADMLDFIRKPKCEFTRLYFSDRSKPVEAYKYERMLDAVLAKKYPDENERRRRIQEIMDSNYRRAPYHFDKGAKNVFREGIDIIDEVENMA